MSKKSCIFSSLSIQCKLDRTTWTWCTRSVEISCIFTFRMNLCEYQTVCLVHLYIVNILCKWTRLLGNTVELLIDSYIVCPRSDPFYVVTYYIKWPLLLGQTVYQIRLVNLSLYILMFLNAGWGRDGITYASPPPPGPFFYTYVFNKGSRKTVLF